jgi:hypothetical protein
VPAATAARAPRPSPAERIQPAIAASAPPRNAVGKGLAWSLALQANEAQFRSCINSADPSSTKK